jgi:hypothetical protein
MPLRMYDPEGEREKASVEDKKKKKKMLTGGQAKLDKNKNKKIDAEDFKILRAEKAKGRGQGLQDEKMKPGKVMKARRGDFMKRRMMLAGKSDGDTSFDAKKRAQDMGIIDKKTGAGRKRFMEKAKSVKLGKRLLIPIAIGIAGVQALKSKMKKDKKEKPKKKMGGGMMKKRIGGMSTKDDNKRDIRKVESMIGASRSSKREQAIKKRMGGGMMQRPMGMMKKGQMVKARGGGMARTKPTKMF